MLPAPGVPPVVCSARQCSDESPCRMSTPSPPIRLVIVDDSPLIRAGLRAVLEGNAAVEIVGEAGNGREAVELAASGDWAEALQNEVSAWKSGDVAYYTELELKSYATMPHGSDVRHALVEVRNAPIADKLAGYLASGKIHFAVLTAPHLVGPGNLIDELVKRGFKVQRL